MLIKHRDIFKYVPARLQGVLHGGAHAMEEYDFYRKIKIADKVTWIEANPNMVIDHANKVKEGDRLIAAALWSQTGIMFDFHIANNGESSSLLEFGTHAKEHREVKFIDTVTVATSTLNVLALQDGHEDMFQADFLNLDIQGAELEALKGATTLLEGNLKYLYLEVNEKPLYKECGLLPEIEEFLTPYGFNRVLTEMTVHGWGDALWIRS